MSQEWQGIPITAVVSSTFLHLHIDQILSCKKPISVLYNIHFYNNMSGIFDREFSLEDLGSLQSSLIVFVAWILLMIYGEPINSFITSSEKSNVVTSSLYVTTVVYTSASCLFFLHTLFYAFNGRGAPALKVMSCLQSAFAECCIFITILQLAWGLLWIEDRFSVWDHPFLKILVPCQLLSIAALMAWYSTGDSLYLFEGFTPTTHFWTQFMLASFVLTRIIAVAFVMRGAQRTYFMLNAADHRGQQLFKQTIGASIAWLMVLPVLSIIVHNRELGMSLPTYPFDYVWVSFANVLVVASLIRLFDEANVRYVVKCLDNDYLPKEEINIAVKSIEIPSEEDTPLQDKLPPSITGIGKSTRRDREIYHDL
eukprot:GHVH01000383.1.p1 GENE.GHVH01000383.1~~GHVH01000383.1.p1  ORF type:complete len:368 (+),score=26.59 GHVH01000383.1:337-1440(+)